VISKEINVKLIDHAAGELLPVSDASRDDGKGHLLNTNADSIAFRACTSFGSRASSKIFILL